MRYIGEYEELEEKSKKMVELVDRDKINLLICIVQKILFLRK